MVPPVVLQPVLRKVPAHGLIHPGTGQHQPHGPLGGEEGKPAEVENFYGTEEAGTLAPPAPHLRQQPFGALAYLPAADAEHYASPLPHFARPEAASSRNRVRGDRP